MKFTTIPCHEALRPFIRNYWLLEAYCTARGTQQIFPNGATSLHFYLSQPMMIDGCEKLYRTALNRHDTECMRLTAEKGPFVIFGVEFVPFCSRMFFGMDLEKAHLRPSELGNIGFEEVADMVHSADGTEARTELLDDFFLKRLSEMPVDEMNMERMNDVFDEIVPTGRLEASSHLDKENLSPADLASIAHLGQKQFTRVFNKSVGMNPKSYLRLLRFHKALMELQKAESKDSLTETAWNCGYYDLSHMTSDFRQICGYSPSELLKAESGLTEAFQHEFSALMKKKIKVENMI